VARAGLDGRLRADWAVFEIDEATLPIAVEEIRPRAVIVGNLFRDQLDRYASWSCWRRPSSERSSGCRRGATRC
jgi:hypothetical protein